MPGPGRHCLGVGDVELRAVDRVAAGEGRCESQAQLARDNIGKIDLVTTWLPLIGLLVGLVLLVAGLIIMVATDRSATRGAHRREAAAEPDAPTAPV